MTNEAITNEIWDVRMGWRRGDRRADPGTLEDQHVKDYLLWPRTEKRAASGTLRGDVTSITQLASARDERSTHQKRTDQRPGLLEHRISLCPLIID
ncbi:MAG: hypothetical protein O2983_11620 [Planctomycetota bacterium]|nr:hypothetical protein [Planctomycetota bacterium]MDA0920072.1 hypothetical protein [Planctomycetota bacterium]MDA1160250.1 hypothetical protein [Planctomycetota bacterium]